jgi:hypothetical protein
MSSLRKKLKDLNNLIRNILESLIGSIFQNPQNKGILQFQMCDCITERTQGFPGRAGDLSRPILFLSNIESEALRC